MASNASSVSLGTGVTLSYVERGNAFGSPLVLLPGPTDSWLSYEPVLDELPPSVRAIAVSQRGHGDSDKPQLGYAVEDFAGDVVALLDALAIKRAVLCGHSGSCLTARRVAIDRPDRVAGLVLEASPLTLKDHAGLEAFVASVVSGLEDPIDPGFARSFVVDTSSETVDATVVDELVRELLKVPARVWHAMFDGLLAYDDTTELARVTAPTLLVWGDADGIVDRDTQDALRARIADADLLVYRGVGHTPRWEDPARFATDIAAFVRRAG